MQIRFIPCLIFHIYKSEKSGGWVGMVGGGRNIARGDDDQKLIDSVSEDRI